MVGGFMTMLNTLEAHVSDAPIWRFEANMAWRVRVLREHPTAFVCLIALMGHVLFAIGCGDPIRQGESTPDNNGVVDAKLAESEQAKIARLVASLASPNPTPRIEQKDDGDGSKLFIASDYDFASQAKIEQAANEMAELGRAAFPALIAGLDDERYSLSTYFDFAWENHTVGEVCAAILRGHLDVYDDCIHGGYVDPVDMNRMSYFGMLRHDGLDKWWKDRRESALWQLQIESIEWARDNEEKRFGKPFKTNHEKDSVREPYDALVKRLRDSKLPVKWRLRLLGEVLVSPTIGRNRLIVERPPK